MWLLSDSWPWVAVGGGWLWALRLCCSVSVSLSEPIGVCMEHRAWRWSRGAAIRLLCSWDSCGAACWLRCRNVAGAPVLGCEFYPMYQFKSLRPSRQAGLLRLWE